MFCAKNPNRPYVNLAEIIDTPKLRDRPIYKFASIIELRPRDWLCIMNSQYDISRVKKEIAVKTQTPVV